MRKIVVASLICWTLLGAAEARGQLLTVGDFDLSLTETFFVDFHQGRLKSDVAPAKDFNFMLFRNRLNVVLSSSWLEAGMRIDTAYFLAVTDGGRLSDNADDGTWDDLFDNKYDNDIDFMPEKSYLPEKLYLSVRKRNFSMDLGDFYATLGKGIALSIKKVDELSTDTTLRGAKAVYRDQYLSLTALGGFSNIVNVGDLILERFDDPNDLIVGMEMKVRPIDWLEFGIHGSLIKDNEDYQHVATSGDYQRDQLAVLGTAVTIPDLAGVFSLNVEYDYLTNEVARFFYDNDAGRISYPGQENSGHALYSMLSGNWSIFHLITEFKFYKGFKDTGVVGKEIIGSGGITDLVYYGALPPLEDPGLFLRPDFYDQWGVRVRLDTEIPATNSIVFVSYAHADDLEDHPFPGAESYVKHVIAGVEQRVDHLSIVGKLAGGYRMDKFSYEWDHRMWHIDGELHFSIIGPHSMELLGRYESYSDQQPNIADFSIAKSTVTYTFAPWVTTSLNYEFSNQPPTEGQEHFLSGEVVVRFMSASYIKLLYGSTRGGLRCAGGMCRVFPKFEGFKGEVTVRF